jgi:hypothetical protein
MTEDIILGKYVCGVGRVLEDFNDIVRVSGFKLDGEIKCVKTAFGFGGEQKVIGDAIGDWFRLRLKTFALLNKTPNTIVEKKHFLSIPWEGAESIPDFGEDIGASDVDAAGEGEGVWVPIQDFFFDSINGGVPNPIIITIRGKIEAEGAYFFLFFDQVEVTWIKNSRLETTLGAHRKKVAFGKIDFEIGEGVESGEFMFNKGEVVNVTEVEDRVICILFNEEVNG